MGDYLATYSPACEHHWIKGAEVIIHAESEDDAWKYASKLQLGALPCVVVLDIEQLDPANEVQLAGVENIAIKTSGP